MPGLDDLPAHRQQALMWRHLLNYESPENPTVRDRDGVDALVRSVTSTSCTIWQRSSDGTPVAIRGNDGRFHLVIDGQPQCAIGTTRGAYRHEQYCYWWTDHTRYTIQAPAGAWERADEGVHLREGVDGRLDYRWTITLTDEVVDPATIHPYQRCPGATETYWPGHHGDGPMGRMRARLVAAFGPRCLACRSQPGSSVDHDHFTGYVRGLLCRFCNTHIDECMHPTGCAYADYLNNPPAAAWRSYYPKSRSRNNDGPSTQAKIAAWGHDPLYRNATDQRRREPHRPAPTEATGLDLSAVSRETFF